MADRWAVASGNWSNTATWNGGTLPTAADDVFADGFTVTINQNVTVLSVRTTQRSGGTIGGTFTLNDGFTLTANVFASNFAGASCVNFSAPSPATATIIGNIYPGTNFGVNYAVSNSNTGTLNIIGNCFGLLQIISSNQASCPRAVGNNNGTTNIIGNCTGGASLGALCVGQFGPGLTQITGNCIGGSGGDASGAQLLSNGTIVITGDCVGGAGSEGCRHGSTGTITINGTAVGGSNGAAGATNNSTGTLNILRAKGNGFGLGSVGINAAVGVFSAQSSITNVQEIEYGDLGQSPTSGPIRLTDLTSNKAIFYRPSLTKKTLVDQAASGGMPSASNVRSGTSFNFGNTTGTLSVPAANQVAVGVAVDNTIGTAVLTVANVQSILNASIVPAAIVERSQSDTQPINFAWPTTGATITAAVSINNGSFVSTVGTVSFLRTETTGKHIYSLSYNAADRPSSEGQARYVLTDGSHTRSFSLSVQNIAVKNISVEDNSITID